MRLYYFPIAEKPSSKHLFTKCYSVAYGKSSLNCEFSQTSYEMKF